MSWKEQLKRVVKVKGPRRPAREEVLTFLAETVAPALASVAEELARHGRDTELEVEPDQASIRVFRDGKEEFFYAVKARRFRKTTFAFPEMSFEDEEEDLYWRPMVHTDEGPQHYGILDYSRDQVLANFMHEYDKQLRWQRPTRPES